MIHAFYLNNEYTKVSKGNNWGLYQYIQLILEAIFMEYAKFNF